MSAPHYTVLGSGGFVGRRLLATLRASGADCYAPARNDGDVFKRDLGRIFYCIGLTADYSQRPFETVEAHVSFLSRILEKASFEKLIYLSSTRLYDSLRLETVAEDTNLILNPANPRHLYDFSKALGENLCLTASEERACVARLASVYDSEPESPGFLSALLQRLKHERKFTIDSDSGSVRDYVFLDDVVQALIRILNGAEKGIVNIASGENVSNQDIVDTLNAAGFSIDLKRQTARNSVPLCDIKKIKALGIDPVSVQSYLQHFIKGQGLNATHSS